MYLINSRVSILLKFVIIWPVVALISGSIVDASDGGPNATVISPGVIQKDFTANTFIEATPPPDNKLMKLVPASMTPFHTVMHWSPVVGGGMGQGAPSWLLAQGSRWKLW